MTRMRLLVVDDHILFREGLSRLLASEPDFEIEGNCGSISDALEVLKRTEVDVVLLDFDLGEDNGSQFICSARGLGFTGKILMVTAGMTAKQASTALQMGASGIFLKHSSPGTLAKAIRTVASGEVWMDQKVLHLMASAVQEGDEQIAGKSLTERELEVLEGIFEGLANKEIAGRLNVTESAVKATLQQLFRKTGVRTRSQLVRIALEWSLGTTPKQ
ncbi:MAG: response regulator [Blastocatellia bacterium]